MQWIVRHAYCGVVAGSLLAFGGLGCDDDDDAPVGDCAAYGTDVTVLGSSTHGHEFEISQADVLAGERKTYDIKGKAGHNHQITVQPEHFLEIFNGYPVRLQSTKSSQHSHGVSIKCASAPEEP